MPDRAADPRSLTRTKHVGIVACSAEGAALCYRLLCREAQRVLGTNDHPRVTLDSIPMARWMPHFEAGDLDAVAEIILDSTRLLAGAGAGVAICPDNTAHLAWDRVQAETPIPWLHIAVAVGDAARERGYQRVGVLGTRFTMDGPVYRETLGAMGIGTISPQGRDAEVVDRVIFDELVNGVVDDASRRAYVEVIARLADRGCDAVALACTEIPLLVDDTTSPLPTLDSTHLLAVAALRVALDDEGSSPT